MATITTPNDPNRNVSTANAAPQQPNPVTNSGVQTQSGQFSTLQKYLGANKNAGQRIAGMVGGNLGNEATQMKNTTQRELGESNQSNQNFGNLTNQTQGFTQQLSQPAQGTNAINGKAYDVNSYQTNLGGQQAAGNIANDANQLQTFTGIRSGDTGAQQKAASDKEAQEALQAATRAYDTNKERQSQLVSNPGRDQLIAQALNTKNQRAGIRNLDNAFLTQDKSGALNNLSNNLRQNVGGIQQNINQGQTQAADVTGLNQNQMTAQTGLNDRLTAMQQEYDTLLNNRVGSVNDAKTARMKQLEDEFGKLQRGEAVNDKFAEMLQLQNVMNANPTPGMVSTDMGMNQKPYEGVRLFNTVQGQGLKNFLDTGTLEQKALTGSDVANNADIGNLNNLAALMGKNNAVTQASKFTGNQVGESSLDEALNKRANQFQTEDLLKGFSGQGSGQESIMRNGIFGSNRVGTAYGTSGAATTLNDYINNGEIYRSTAGNENTGGMGNVLGNLGNVLSNIASGALIPGGALADLVSNPDRLQEITQSVGNVVNSGAAGLAGLSPAISIPNQTALNTIKESQRQQLLANGLRAGGTSGGYHGSKDQGRAMTLAEGQAVDSVKNQADQYIKDIGYNNLLKLTQGDF